ncbi:LPXTG cell wall anchor domain-containing protein [Micromonospora sp. NBC_00858]|uniref:DUF7507 domain-containing protein n=1 Tax=Micromonospora sp. NBC_00858 TaxID=2975979 RepID=UPI003869B905|nr:DUF11 domain-containing protein [Micromonospora sp. NBC_00858]
MSETSASRRRVGIRTRLGAFALLAGALLLTAGSPAVAAPEPQVYPKLELIKTGTPATGLQAGDKVTYTYTVKNQSTGTHYPITNITVTDDTVTGITCKDTKQSATEIEHGLELAPGESATCTGKYTVTRADVKAGKVVNTATATGLFRKEKVTSNKAEFTVTTKAKRVQASLSIDKKARIESDCRKKCENDGFASKGDKIFYTYRVTNTGTETIKNVAVDDKTAGPVACKNTWLAPGTSTDCHAVHPHVVTWADVKAGKVVNTARATGTFYDKKIVSDPATVTVCIRDGKFDHRHDGKDGKHDQELPVTGDNTTNILSLGGGLLAAGGLLLGASRLRRMVRIQA